MEDIVKLLFVVGIVIIGIARQNMKKSKAGMSDAAASPTEDKPQNEEEKRERDAALLDLLRMRRDNMPARKGESLPKREEVSEEAMDDYGLHSPEEARRAVIWSEILRRKYF